MEKEFLKNQKQLTKERYVIVSSYFLDNCVEILGTGPSMLYIQLLNYCYKGKDLAWPTLTTLGKKMQFTPKSITKFHQILLKHGLIKKISKGKTASGNYRRNIYQVTPLCMVKNTLSLGNISPHTEEKFTPNLRKKLPINNNNLNHNNITTTNKENVVVDFKKLKEEGEEKMMAMKEQLKGLDFEESFIEKLLKDFPVKKIEEKLDLLMEKRNIQSLAGWLMAALKNDYQGTEEERDEEEPKEEGKESNNLTNTAEWTSREKALEAIKLIRKELSRLTPSPSSCRGREPS